VFDLVLLPSSPGFSLHVTKSCALNLLEFRLQKLDASVPFSQGILNVRRVLQLGFSHFVSADVGH